MTRLKQAWLALCGRLEPEVREVVSHHTILGSPEEVTLYEVRRAEMIYSDPFAFSYPRYTVIARYLTCEQAHAEHPGMTIAAAKFWRIGKTYLSGLQVLHIEVQPKPKIAKGARNG